ncbi:MAG: histidinol-phosphatase HisJ family protein [Ruminococcus sp.]|jgi:histidinol-phosphatase (PHP family)|nr:histidinol-phosphatase HisJ family protein [Ruminococcus sp.]
MKNLIDLHSHSHNSVDAKYPTETMINAAIKKGISIYAITDHCEMNRYYSDAHYGVKQSDYEYETFDNAADFEKSMKENTACKLKLREENANLKFLSGIELGQATFDFGLSESLIADKRLDFVIASIHQLKNRDDFAFIKYNKYNDEQLFSLCEEYFEEIKKLCAWGKFDVLGHLTYILRYMEGNAGRTINISLFYQVIRECFKLIIHSGKGIEVNTSGLRQKKFGKTFPDFNILHIYHEMGGEILTIGSDSHTPEDVGAGIPEALEMIKEIGFKWLCYYENREPHFIGV